MKCKDCRINIGDCPFATLKLENPEDITGCNITEDKTAIKAFDQGKQIDGFVDALREIAAGNLDDETQADFADRCVRVAKEALA